MLKNLILSLAVGLLLISCSSIEIDPKAKRVIASNNPAPQGCRYRGEVTGNQGNFFTGGLTSNKNLEQGARNDMRNAAAAIGANYVQIIGSRSSISGSYRDASVHESGVTYTGNAYYCPPSLIGL